MKFFLDIDGVMVHANPHRRVELEEDGFYKFNPLAVEILNSMIDETEDELILSTSHRFRFDIPKWTAIFRSRGIAINKLSILNLPLEYKSNRKTEILNWLSESKLSPDEIVIIDDDKSLNELPAHLKQRLVLTDPYIGLNSNSELSRILNRKPKK